MTAPVVRPSESSGGSSLITTTDQFGDRVVLSGATPGAVISTTDAEGHTIVTTITPGGGEVSSIVLQTSTLAGGKQTTITSFASVAASGTNAGEAATPTGGAGASGTGPAPGLQSAGAEKMKSYGTGMVALAAVGMAVVM